MLKMIAKRLFSLLIILFGLSFLTFGLTFLLPSDPVTQQIEAMGGGVDDATIAKMRAEYGLDKPFMVRYADYVKGIFHGDLGTSVKYKEPVSTVLARKLPNTILLACTSFLLMILIAFPLGILSSVYKNRIADYIIRFLSFIGVAMPSFWFGMILIWLLGVKMNWLPASGTGTGAYLVMPTITLGVSMSAYYIRRVRAVMVEQMGEEYISGCKSRGVGRGRIIFLHVLPNSLLALVTMLGMSFGGMLGGTMIVETIFSWNGIGKAAVDAISGRDYQLIQGYALWMGFIYVMVNLIVDISYQFIDPRIRKGMVKA